MKVDHKLIEAMEKYGGGFINALANLWIVSDSANRARIEREFKPEFDRYRSFIK